MCGMRRDDGGRKEEIGKEDENVTVHTVDNSSNDTYYYT